MKPEGDAPRILMIAYACNPKGSGEHWLGWGWAEQAARSYRVDLITTTNAEGPVRERAKECGINAHFVGLPEWQKKLTSKLGGVGSWLRKIIWQRYVARLAEKLHQQEPFAIVHQTTFHTFRVPFRAAGLGIPSVWGPIAGGEYVPPGFARYLGAARFGEAARRFVNRLWLQFPSIKKSLRQVSTIFVSNQTTLGFLPKDIQAKCQVVPPNALRPEDENLQPAPRRARIGNGPLRLLYVGNCVATRAIPLVFDALVQSGMKEYKFWIVGGGPAIPAWKQRAAELGFGEKVEFVGKVPYEKLPGYYNQADALVFPALRDSGGSALLEAMSRNLPVICLDWAGPGEMVDAASGIKVPVSTPETAIKSFGEAMVRLREDAGLGSRLAAAARERAQSMFRWDAKYRLLQVCYERLIKR